MAAKEEALILKYLKKNPDSEALDVSFGTDVDESVVKETLQQLLSKQQVAEKVSDSGVSTWTIAVPPPKPVAPKPEKPAKVAKSDDDVSVDVPASSDDDESSSSGKGSGKGFVLFVAILTAAISIGASYVIGSGKIASEKAAFDLQLKNATDSVGFYKIETNKKLDALQQEIKKLQAPPAEEAAPAKAAKPAPKKVVKKKR